MIRLSYALRGIVFLACVFVLSGIVPISLAQLRTGHACPLLGPIPACHVVTLSYAAMAAGVSVLWSKARWLFFAGAAPVILLALTGTTLELTRQPTCPRSDSGWPLCYTSLFVGSGLLAIFILAIRFEQTEKAPTNA